MAIVRKIEGIVYECISCHHQTATEFSEPQDWKLQQHGVPRLRCPKCGAACGAEPWMDRARSGGGEFPWQWFFQSWSNCPNAYACSQFDQYAGDCEGGLVMQKCFVSVHQQLGIATHLLKDLAKPSPGRRAKKSAVPDS